jgi:hypothetical protein
MAVQIWYVAAECERRASEFRQQAEQETLPLNRMLFLELEQHWLQLACLYYQTDRLLAKLGPDRNSDRDPLKWLNSSGHSIH